MQLGPTASNGFSKREMILHSGLYVAKLSKMGSLAFSPNVEERFLFNQLGNRVYRNFQELILKACKGIAYHDQVEIVLEICKAETIS